MPTDLDLEAALAGGDPTGFLPRTAALPEQCADARARAAAIERPREASSAECLLVAGMGGSAIAAELLGGLLGDRGANRLRVHRHWELPAGLSPRTLVAVASYSGMTPEALSAYDAARKRGLPLVAVSSGGELAGRARRDRVPWLELPGGYPPRSAVAYAYYALARVAAEAGLAGAAEGAEVSAHLAALRELWGPASPVARNGAKGLALALHGRLALVHAAGPATRAVARRFANQLAENAKALALVSEYPELAHNEVVAWDGDRSLLARLAVVELVDPEEHPAVARLRAGVREFAAGAGAPVVELEGRGSTALERLWSLVYLTDLASVYLAILEGHDPALIRPIERLKKAQRREA